MTKNIKSKYLIKEFEDFYLKYKSGLLVCVGVHVTSNAPIVCLRDLPQDTKLFIKLLLYYLQMIHPFGSKAV